jgi:chromosomal replication initiation ATPase DnaA
MSLARELTKASFPVIGRAFGRDHSTAMHAVDRSPELLEKFPEYVAKRAAVLVRLGQSEPT